MNDWEEAWICDGTDRTLIEYLDHQEQLAHTPQLVWGMFDEAIEQLDHAAKQLDNMNPFFFSLIPGLAGVFGGVGGAIRGLRREWRKP